ncbi:40S ribosomal protein S21-2-like protein [Tanacetum coccineum]
MQNEQGQNMDLYILRKCSATNRFIASKDHASVEISVRRLYESARRPVLYFCSLWFCASSGQSSSVSHKKDVEEINFLMKTSPATNMEAALASQQGWVITKGDQHSILGWR